MRVNRREDGKAKMKMKNGQCLGIGIRRDVRIGGRNRGKMDRKKRNWKSSLVMKDE